jgi:AraC-like DNA-binding protein
MGVIIRQILQKNEYMDNISPVYARFVLREALRQGIAEEQLFLGTSLDRPGLEGGGDIAMNEFLTILRNGRELTGNEALGLVIGRHSNIMALGQMGAAAAIAPTVRTGLQVFESYSRLHVTYISIQLVSNLQGLSVRFRFLQDTGEVERFHSETAVMLVQHYLESLTGKMLANAQYRLAFPRPGYAQEYSKWMHSPVSFDREYSSVELPAQGLDLPSPYYDAQMWQQATLTLAQQLRKFEGEQPYPYSQYVRALLGSSEPPLPDLSTVAQRIHMSERTLNRRLNSEGASYRAIKGEVMADWACRHLRETTQSVEAIAAALGYQDTANFRRAFRKAQGCTPSEFRGRHG